MAEEQPLDKLLHQIGEMFKLIEENKDKDFEKNVTPEVTERLETLKDLFDQFNVSNRKVWEEAGSSVQALHKTVLMPSDTIEVRWHRLFEFSKNLKRDVEKVRFQNNLSSDAIRKDQPFDKTKQKKDEIKKRKKKFKQMGGDADWMRL